MIDTPISIVSVNMWKRNPLFIAFLQATHADIVIVMIHPNFSHPHRTPSSSP